ncbi:hypothetical protein HB904_16990 [Listeria booriae]|uniref:Phage protein n=1 Tax=Listeria booriae TaxID=1552123 RepID=A0A842AFN6_9LIST|nr:hypothetical protein [Listeria booriae]MBC1402144.1 hypothetical protein [Listeria booriae]MBC1617876.1 hypothetical protein [Listeria booriae]
MKITLIDEKGKSKTYKKTHANMEDAMSVMEFQLRQKQRYSSDENTKEMKADELEAFYIQRNYDAYKDAVQLIVNVFGNQFEQEDVLRSVKRKDFSDVMDKVITDVMNGESEEKKDDK